MIKKTTAKPSRNQNQIEAQRHRSTEKTVKKEDGKMRCQNLKRGMSNTKIRWTYGRLINRLVELGFQNIPNERDCVALRHPTGAILLLPSFAGETPLNITHFAMAKMAFSTYRIGFLEPVKDEKRQQRRIEKLKTNLNNVWNELALLGFREQASMLADVREQLQSA